MNYYKETKSIDLLYSWRRIRNELSFTEELWIFSFHSDDLPKSIEGLSFVDEGKLILSSTSLDSTGNTLEITTMLFGALNSKLETLFFHHRFIPLGQFSVYVPLQRSGFRLRNRDPKTEESSITISWKIFISGNHICLKIIISNKRILPIQNLEISKLDPKMTKELQGLFVFPFFFIFMYCF